MSKNTISKQNDLALSIAVAHCMHNVSWSIRSTQHIHYFLFWNPTGKVTLTFEGKEVIVDSDRAVLIPPCTSFGARSEGIFSHLYAHFSIGEPFCNIRKELYFLPADPARAFFRKKLFDQVPQWRTLLSWHSLICEYLRLLPEEAFAEKNDSAGRDSRIRAVLEYCSENLLHAPDNRTLAKYAGMSLNNFQRAFLRETGLPPQKYLHQRKLDHARKLLLESTLSIEKIAQECSYADRYHFSKAFKKYFGLTPGTIRSGHRSNAGRS